MIEMNILQHIELLLKQRFTLFYKYFAKKFIFSRLIEHE